uniref:Niemann-Pick C1 N-terminal domain-containing protein n=1 Tax=Strigamia maritima TaxID=126957 RepID=T1IKK4_STRMM
MIFTTSVLVCLLLFVSKVGAEDTCVWYGQCHTSDKPPVLNCLYSGLPKPLGNASVIEVFNEICPELVNRSGKTVTCCNADQIEILADGLVNVKPLLARCPSCWHNFRNFLCVVTCSPNQSRYMNVTRPGPEDLTVSEHDFQKVVKSVEFMLTESYTKAFFDSCKSVSNPTMGNTSKAIDTLCGKANFCTKKRFLTYLLEKVTSFPLNTVNVTFWNNNITTNGRTFQPLNLTVAKCNERIGNENACDCVDCDDSCPKFPETFNQSGISFPVVVAFLILCIIIKKRKKKRQSAAVTDPHKPKY